MKWAAFAVFLVLANCHGQVAGSAPSGPQRIVVAYSAISGGELPLWAAKDGNMFQTRGLDVQPLLILGGQNSMAALLSGQAQIIESGGSDVIAADVGGADVVVLATMMPVYPYELEVGPAIKTPGDLKGKKLAAGATGSSADVATRTALRKLGLNPEKDLTIVSVQGRQVGTTALLNGAVDGLVDDPPGTLLLDGKGFHVLFDMADLHLPAAQTVVAANRDWVAGHHDAVQRFVDAQAEAIDRVRADKTFAVRVLRRYFKSDDEAAMAATYDYYVNKIIPARPYARPEQFADSIAELTRHNDQVQGFDPRTIVDNSFVSRAA